MTAVELNSFEQEIIDNVNAHGCHVMGVFDPDGDEPDFSYSIGFWETVDQPEVVVFGLSLQIMRQMINEAHRQCRSDLHLCNGTVVEGLLEGHACVVRAVLPANLDTEYLSSAQWYHQYRTGSDLEQAIQLVWPSAATGLFPWDQDCEPRVRALQPALYEESKV